MKFKIAKRIPISLKIKTRDTFLLLPRFFKPKISKNGSFINDDIDRVYFRWCFDFNFEWLFFDFNFEMYRSKKQKV